MWGRGESNRVSEIGTNPNPTTTPPIKLINGPLWVAVLATIRRQKIHVCGWLVTLTPVNVWSSITITHDPPRCGSKSLSHLKPPNKSRHAPPTPTPPSIPRPHPAIPHNYPVPKGTPSPTRHYRSQQSKPAMEARRTRLLDPNRHPHVRTQVESPPLRTCCCDELDTLLYADDGCGAKREGWTCNLCW